MKTFALSSGDLVLAGNAYGMVAGTARVQQQIALCLREPFGSDRFHTRWGSVLPEWIGRTIDNSSQLGIEIRAELIRVVKNFIAAQTAQIEDRSMRGLRPVIMPSEVIVDVQDIRVIQDQDSIIVKATLLTQGGQEFSIITAPGRADGYTR